MTNPHDFCMNCMKQLQQPKGVCPHCGFDNAACENDAHQLECGSILAGSLLVGRVLGQGGFGITYVGWDLNLEIKVAIKEYYPEGCVTRDTHTHVSVLTYAGSKETFFQKGKERFVGEARALAKYSGDSGVVGVRTFFYENGTAYIVMDFVEGETLKAYAARLGGKLPSVQVLSLFQPLIRSIARVHESGLLHRDISPDNIMLRSDGTLALLDFGAARQISVAGEHSNTINVKHGFAPEEQYRTRGEQGPWTDVYALCATIYRLTTGVTPTEALDRIVNDEPLAPPSAYGADFSPEQEAALMHGLALRASARTKDMDELTKELYGVYFSSAQPILEKQVIGEAYDPNIEGKIKSQQEKQTADHFNSGGHDENPNTEINITEKNKGKSVFPIVFIVIVVIVLGFIFIRAGIGSLNYGNQEATALAETALLNPDPVSITLNYNETFQCSVNDFDTNHSVSDQDVSWSCTDSASGLKCSFSGLLEAGALQLSPESGYNTDVEVKGIASNGMILRYLVQVGNGQSYSFEMSSSPRTLKTVHVNTLIASPDIVDCTGLTVDYGFEMTKGKFSASNWSVWVRDNNDQWIYIQDIDATAGQSKEYVLDFDQPITVSEIVIQPPREYNAFSYNMTLQIVHIKH